MSRRRLTLWTLVAGLALTGGLAQASAQAVATGAGRADELSEAARIDAYLADSSSRPATAAQGRVTASEAAASAGAIPPMDPDSPWSRGVSGPTGPEQAFSQADGAAPACDHRLHGEVGAELGSGGSKGGYGVVTAPVGKDCAAQVTVGVSASSGRGYGGYRGYDRSRDVYGGFGYAPHGGSSALSLGFSAGDARSPGAVRGPLTDDPPPF